MKKCEKTNKEGLLDAIKYPVHLITCLSPCTTLRFDDDKDFVPAARNKTCHKCGCQKKEKNSMKNSKDLGDIDDTTYKQTSLKKTKSQINANKKKGNELFQESSLIIQPSTSDQINLKTCIYCSNLPVCSERKEKQEIKENTHLKRKVAHGKSEEEISKPLRVPKKVIKIPEDVKRKRAYVFTSEIDKTASSSILTISHSSQENIEPVKPKNVTPYIIDSMVCRCEKNGINCTTYPKYENISNDSIYRPKKHLPEKNPQIVNCCSKDFDSIKCSCPTKQETPKLVGCDCEHKNQKIVSCACVPKETVSCTCPKEYEKKLIKSESHAQTDLKYFDLRVILPSSTGSTQTDHEEKMHIKHFEHNAISPIKIQDKVLYIKDVEHKASSPIKQPIADKSSSPMSIKEKTKSPVIPEVKSKEMASDSSPTPQSKPSTPKKRKNKKAKRRKLKSIAVSKSQSQQRLQTTRAYTMPSIELNSMSNLEQILKLSSIIQSKNEEINRLNSIVNYNESPYHNSTDQPQTIKIVFENLPCSIAQINEITSASPSPRRQISNEDTCKKETPI